MVAGMHIRDVLSYNGSSDVLGYRAVQMLVISALWGNYSNYVLVVKLLSSLQIIPLIISLQSFPILGMYDSTSSGAPDPTEYAEGASSGVHLFSRSIY
jgi:hypothetical protein